jgi:hypothetical protein
MKAFIFGFQTNYDLGAAIVYAESKEQAIEIAKRSSRIWDTWNVYEIDLNTKSKIIHITESDFIEEVLKQPAQ